MIYNSIPVEQNFTVRIELFNPFCFFDELPGNVGVGIEIPVNEYSRAYFGNPERFEKYSEASARKFPGFEIRKKGSIIEAGTLVITSANDEWYKGWLQPEVGVLGEEQKDKYIYELDWKSDVAFEDKGSYDYQTDHYCVAKLRNEHFWEGKGAHTFLIIPYQNEDNEEEIREEYINVFNNQFGEESDYVVNSDNPLSNSSRVVSPFLFFRYFVKELLRLNRFYIAEHPFDNIPGVNNLAVYNNFNLFDPVPSTAERNIFYFDKKANRFIATTVEAIESTSWILRNFSYSDLVPKISLPDAIISIQNHLNVCFQFLPDRTVKIIDREAVFDQEPFDLTPYQISDWSKGEKKKVSLKFTPEQDKEDANFDDYHDLSDRISDLREGVDTYSDLLTITDLLNPLGDRTIGQLRYVRDENKVYEFKWTTSNLTNPDDTEEQLDILGWEMVSTGQQPYVYQNGDEIEEIKTSISTLQMDNGWLSARQKGNVNAMRNLWTDFTFRMFYYMGGENGSVNYAGENVSCNWEGEDGIFNRRWKKTARFWANRLPIEAQFSFPQNVWRYIKNNITKKYSSRGGEFIIESIQQNIGTDLNGVATIKAYKV